jgi:hypothetical protein
LWSAVVVVTTMEVAVAVVVTEAVVTKLANTVGVTYSTD